MENEAKEFRKLFPRGQIPIVLLSILQAGKTLRKKTEKDREDWITRRLYVRLICIPIFRDGPLGIHLKPEIVDPDEPDANMPTGELDLLVSIGHGYEIYFPLEAKRLRVIYANGRLETGSDKYIKEGMMRFVSGQYAPFMEAGAMLGYVYDGNTVEARSDIDRSLQNHAVKLRLLAPQKLSRSQILEDMPVDETLHSLETRIFTIYHVFLAV